MQLQEYPVAYFVTWIVACAVAAVVALKEGRNLSFVSRDYARLLWTPWRIVTIVVAGGTMVVVAPYAGDPTWDYFDAAFMVLLTYLTSPWAVGILYRVVRRKARWQHAYVAICLMLFSASWSYDAYMIFKPSGPGPVLWKENLLASPLLYLLAGLLWNLDWTPTRKVHLALTTDDWPRREAVEFRHLPLIPYMTPFAAMYVFVVGIFFMSWFFPAQH